MARLQWCKASEGPLFKWTVRDVEEIPKRCLDGGKEQIEVRLVAESLMELRRALGQLALGDHRLSGHASWLNRRKTRASPDKEEETSMVTCTLSGADNDPREIEIPLMYCQDTIRVERDVWFARQQNGDVAVMKGGNRAAGNWMHYFTDVYHKVDKVKDNRVSYTFEKTVQVNRCEATTKKGQRCRLPASEGSEFCNTHVLRTF